MVKITLPHIGLVLLSAAYTLLGATIFHHVGHPWKVPCKSDISVRDALRETYQERDDASRSGAQEQRDRPAVGDGGGQRDDGELRRVGRHCECRVRIDANLSPHSCFDFRMNSIIKDVFIDYTKNYMTPGKFL